MRPGVEVCQGRHYLREASGSILTEYVCEARGKSLHQPLQYRMTVIAGGGGRPTSNQGMQKRSEAKILKLVHA